MSAQGQLVSTGLGSPFKLISVHSTNDTLVKAGQNPLYHIQASNINAAVAYLKLYDKATVPVVGTDVPVATLAIPGATTGGILNISIPGGLSFSKGIGIGLTTGVADADTGAVAAGDVVVNLAVGV